MDLFMKLHFFLNEKQNEKKGRRGEKKTQNNPKRAPGRICTRLIFGAEEIICYISPQPDNPLLLKDEVSINVCLKQM